MTWRRIFASTLNDTVWACKLTINVYCTLLNLLYTLLNVGIPAGSSDTTVIDIAASASMPSRHRSSIACLAMFQIVGVLLILLLSLQVQMQVQKQAQGQALEQMPVLVLQY